MNKLYGMILYQIGTSVEVELRISPQEKTAYTAYTMFL